MQLDLNCKLSFFFMIIQIYSNYTLSINSYTCQPIPFTSIKFLKNPIILGRYGHIGKWIQENTIFMRFCCCFKLRKKSEKLLNEQPTLAITKCTLAQ